MFKSKPIKPPSSSSSSFPCSKRKKLIFFMASLLFLITLFSLILFVSLSSAFHHHHHHHPNQPHSDQTSQKSIPPEIHQACKSTRYPEICETTLLQSTSLPKSNPKPIEIIQSSISISAQNLETAQSMVKTILNSSSSSNPNRLTAAKNCVEALHNSEYRLSSTTEILPRGRIKDARAWMSAALLYQYDCWSALKYVNDSQIVNETMSFINSLIGLTSNSLSMVVSYDLFGDETASWKPPKTERDGFWEDGTGYGNGVRDDLEFKGGFPLELTADLTVCKEEKNEKCSYKKIQDAVDAAPEGVAGEGRRFVIRIGEGVYEETVRVPLEKTNLVFIGEGMGKTVITGSLNADQPGISTYNTATVGVLGDGFMARDMTFQNTAVPGAHQAVAFRSGSDLSIIENCEFLGNQDTLYAHSLRQFYKSCRIEGNVDFIFGNSASIFQDSTISIRPRQVSPAKGENNAVTAHGRTDPAQSTGFVFRNCVINGTDEYMKFYHQKPKVHKNYLGRPWKEYSRTVFIHCYLGELITAEGWLPWKEDFALSTLYYGEFENSGPGANVSSRVEWSSQIPAEHVFGYSVQNFIQGNEWIPDGSS